MEIKKITRLALLLSLSVVLNLIESIIPIFNGTIPGLKLGLANIVILFSLYEFSFKDAITLSIMRVILVGILRIGLFSMAFFFSLSGAILSIIFMYIFKKYTKLSIVGISIIGSLFHSIGQIIIACIFVNTTSMLLYLPWILLFSIPTGILTGILSKELLKNYKLIFTK